MGRLSIVPRTGVGRKLAPEKAMTLPATPRHPSRPLPLLPSGPGGIYGLSSRGDRQGHHKDGSSVYCSLRIAGLCSLRIAKKQVALTFSAGRDCSGYPALAPSLRYGVGLRPTEFVPHKFVEPARVQIPPLRLRLRLAESRTVGSLDLASGGEGGIRTRDTLLTYTHFPGVLLKPLGHLSALVQLLPCRNPARQRSGRITGAWRGHKRLALRVCSGLSRYRSRASTLLQGLAL